MRSFIRKILCIQLYYIKHLPFSSIDNFYYTNNNGSVLIGNTIGDATVINTKSINDSLYISLSQLSTNITELEVNLPFKNIISKKAKNKPVLYISSRFYNTQDPNQSYIETPSINSDVYNNLLNSPYSIPEPGSFVSILNADYVNDDDITFSKQKVNADFQSYSQLLKLILPVNDKLMITLGNYSEFENYQGFIYENALFVTNLDV